MLDRPTQQPLFDVNASGVTPKKDKRTRIQFRFWCDIQKPDESRLAEELDYQKSQRTFAQVIRDALFLFFDLKRGSATLLRQLFPDVVAQIEADARESAAVREFKSLMEQNRQLAELMQRNVASQPVEVEAKYHVFDESIEADATATDNLLNAFSMFGG